MHLMATMRIDASGLPTSSIRFSGGSHVMTEIGQGAFDPAMAPARVLSGETDDEPLDLFHHTRPT